MAFRLELRIKVIMKKEPDTANSTFFQHKLLLY